MVQTESSAETVYKLAKTLGVSMEQLTESGIRETQREHSYEYGLPDYLQHDLDTYKEGLKTHSPLLDCYCLPYFQSVGCTGSENSAWHISGMFSSLMPYLEILTVTTAIGVSFTTSIMIRPKLLLFMIVEAAFYRRLTKKSCVAFWKMKICFMRVFSNFLHQQSS